MRSVEGQAPPFSWPGLHTLHWVFLENSGEWNLWTFLHQLLKRWQTEWDNDVNQVQQARYKNVKQHDATWMHFKSVEEGKIKGYVFLSVSLLWSVRVCVGVCVRVKVTEVKVCEHEHVSHMCHVLLRTHQRFSMWYSVARTHKHSCAGSCFCATKVIQLALSLIQDYLTIHLHFCCVFVSGPKCINTVTPDWRQQMFQIL